jgi:hypothetical protein
MLLRSVRLVLCGLLVLCRLPAIRREPRSPAQLRRKLALQAFGLPIKNWLRGLKTLGRASAARHRSRGDFSFSITMREVVV